MPIPINKIATDFTFIHDNQVDFYGPATGNFNTVQQALDSRGIDVLGWLNDLQTGLKVFDTAGDIGATELTNYGSTTLKIQDQLQALDTALKTTNDSLTGNYFNKSTDDTDDINEGIAKFTTQADIIRLADTSGVNTGDQTIPTKTSDLTNDSLVASVVAGTNVGVDISDPRNPIVNVTPGTGTGDVVGPAGATDNQLAQFDGATGKIIKDGLTVVTSIGTPGIDTNIPTEKSVRDAIDAIPAIDHNDTGNLNAGDYLHLTATEYAGLNDPKSILGGGAIINGNFDIWQRDTSQTATGYGSDDRWRNDIVGSTQVHTQQIFTVGQSDVPNNPDFFSRTVVTSVVGVSNFTRKYQKIEKVSTFAGETVTLSFWAKADASKNIAIEFKQDFGTGGSTDIDSIGSQLVALTTSWTKHEITIAMPSILGKTIGTTDRLEFSFWFEAGSNLDSRTASLGQQSGTFDIAQVKLEKGSTATDYITKTYAEELIDCQRYYYRMGGNTFTAYSIGQVTSGVLAAFVFSFPTSMRNNSYTMVFGGNHAITNAAVALLPTIDLILAPTTASIDKVQIEARVGSGITVGDVSELYSNNDATAFIAIDDEL